MDTRKTQLQETSVNNRPLYPMQLLIVEFRNPLLNDRNNRFWLNGKKKKKKKKKKKGKFLFCRGLEASKKSKRIVR